MRDVLQAVREVRPDARAGAGVLRDLVWGTLFGSGFEPGKVRDVDVVFFDSRDVSRANDDRVTALLSEHRPGIPWEAKNQAAVHTWYARKFGGEPVEPLTSIEDAVGTWPETATAVAVRLDARDRIEVCAPLGLDDLLNGVWRRNPRRISEEQSQARFRRHDPLTRWPGVRVARSS
ncbi:nucleotidyltransferase family protein [Paractinoplanes ovalisporus]|nr:nucleotidyltransferase family protein [Actinoplanes ovalisporus]